MTDDAPATRGTVGRRRRPRVAGGRTGNHRVRVSAEEEAVLQQLAAAQGVDVVELLVESALAGDRETAAMRREAMAELFRVAKLLGSISNNVNQLARHANSGPTFPADAAATLAAVRRLLPRVEETIDGLGVTAQSRVFAGPVREGLDS
jgi:hypothetical protein